MRRATLLSTLVLILTSAFSQYDSSALIILDYDNPVKYKIGGIATHGNQFTDRNIILLMSGLYVGQTITLPGDELRIAVERLWNQSLFSDVEITLAGMKNDKIFLNIVVKERPRLSRWSIKGLRKSQTKDVNEAINLHKNQLITEDLLNQTRTSIQEFFYEKGYYGVTVKFTKELDPEKPNYEVLRIDVDRGKKIKVHEYVITGNEAINDRKIRAMLKPKQLKHKINIFASSKFVQDKLDETLPMIESKYKTMGYRDMKIVYDSVVRVEDDRVDVKIKIDEGNKYYFRNITWVGNTKYRSGLLDTILGIKEGDVYDQSKLEMRLYQNPTGFDVSALYMDDGYLFFNVNPVEVLVENDSIDLEMRIYEGKQATVNRVTVIGNDKTSDFVALRVLRTRPGDKFNRSDIQRSMRELAALGFFDPEGLDVRPKPNPANGTVDIEYVVVEKPSDQIEASGGWGGFTNSFVGTLGLTLNNFSTRKMFQKGGWNPIPAGDGQKLSLRAQSNGGQYTGYSFSFTEPWLGGKKPNSLSISLFHSIQSTFQRTEDRPKFKTTGATIGYGMQLRVPDDYFSLGFALTLQRYSLNNWNNFGAAELGFSNGYANNLSITTTLSRNSTDHPIYPSSGSSFTASVQLTPPYKAIGELFGKTYDYANMSPQERFEWIELNKWKFSGQWFLGFPKNAKRKFVLAPAIRFGMVGVYNDQIGYSPFEQFRVGGSGLSGFVLYGTDIVSQRGYADGRISDPLSGTNVLPIYSKYTLELRYPLTVGQSSTIYAHAFMEAGNAWAGFEYFDPFDVRRAVGTGVRLFLPMFGLLGIDYAWPLDPFQQGAGGEFHFFIGQQF
ncbi:outer membrane protein assembly factor BamA [bacterium]|nr:outer membrane protein assembly factor BamA [bacterium]